MEEGVLAATSRVFSVVPRSIAFDETALFVGDFLSTVSDAGTLTSPLGDVRFGNDVADCVINDVDMTATL